MIAMLTLEVLTVVMLGFTLWTYRRPVAPRPDSSTERHWAIEDAAVAVLADVERRYPGEPITCPLVKELKRAVVS